MNGNIKINPSQILQGGLAAIVAWLFRTVQTLTNEVAVLKAEITNANERLAEVITIVSGISGEITEIIWKKIGIGYPLMTSNNGFTTKEYLAQIKEDVDKANNRIDELHEKINKSPSRQEILGWLIAITSSAAFLNTIM